MYIDILTNHVLVTQKKMNALKFTTKNVAKISNFRDFFHIKKEITNLRCIYVVEVIKMKILNE